MVKLVSDKFVAVTVDGEANPRMVRNMNVKLYPTLLITNANGKVLDRQEGFITAGTMVKFLKKNTKGR